MFVARSDADGNAAVVRVNDEPATVASYPLDELRAAWAMGLEGELAIGWTDNRHQIRVALSRDDATTFEPSIRVERTDKPAYRSFPELAFDGRGALHVAWIDSRFAPEMQEEPADLFYARLRDGTVEELNLTADQVESICGCCRPALNVDPPDTIRITFRNTTKDGYRDIFTLSGSVSDGFSAPVPVSEPLWKLDGCPMAGPTTEDDLVIWPDGSTGTKRLVTASRAGSVRAARPMFTGEKTEWTPGGAPRPVAGLSGDGHLLLFPGQPTARIAGHGPDEWSLVTELPGWTTSALARNGYYIALGAVGGSLHVSSVAAPSGRPD